jgi:cytidyltransferase-like protein
VFDVLHRGHATYLAHARALGGSLVVALNTDASARRLGKGPDRPLNNEEDRAVMMAALESVSLVTWFERGHAAGVDHRIAARPAGQGRRLRHGYAGRNGRGQSLRRQGAGHPVCGWVFDHRAGEKNQGRAGRR